MPLPDVIPTKQTAAGLLPNGGARYVYGNMAVGFERIHELPHRGADWRCTFRIDSLPGREFGTLAELREAHELERKRRDAAGYAVTLMQPTPVRRDPHVTHSWRYESDGARCAHCLSRFDDFGAAGYVWSVANPFEPCQRSPQQ